MSTSVSERELFWRQVIAQRETLHLTVDEACKRTGVSRASFYQWQKRLGKSKGSGHSGPALLMPVRIVEDRVAEITLELPNGIRLRLPLGCDEATLQCVLRAILATPQEPA